MRLFDLLCRRVGYGSQPAESGELIPVPAPIVYDTVDAPKYQASVLSLMDAVRPWFDCDPEKLSNLRLVLAVRKCAIDDIFYVNLPHKLIVRDTIRGVPSIILVANDFPAQEFVTALGQVVVKPNGEALGRRLRPFSGGAVRLDVGDHLKVTHTLTVNGD